jgi:hypothetical protein
MAIYVAEISGRAIAALNAENTFLAEDLFGSAAFHSELMFLRDEDGTPLWDGRAEIHVRSALLAERTIWEEARKEAVAEGNVDEDENKVLVFLIPVFDDAPEDDD